MRVTEIVRKLESRARKMERARGMSVAQAAKLTDREAAALLDLWGIDAYAIPQMTLDDLWAAYRQTGLDQSANIFVRFISDLQLMQTLTGKEDPLAP